MTPPKRGRKQAALTADAPLPRMAKRLRAAREKRGQSLDEVAAACGLSPRSLGSYEAGKHEPLVSAALALAQHYEATVESIFSES